MTEHAPSKRDRPDGNVKPTFLRSLRTVAWGFLGVRKNSEYKDDLAQVNPFHLIIAALLGALFFIGTLLLIVRWVVATA